MKEIINSEKAPAPIGPYNQANLVDGKLLFVSGQLPLNAATGSLVTDTVENEVNQIMENIKMVLSAANMSLENVVKTTIFCTNLGDFKTINEVYGSYFTGNYPARETVQVAALPLGVHVEISVIATK